MGDAFIGCFFAAVILSILELIPLYLFKPSKRIAGTCIVGGVVFAVTGFLTEALAASANLWHYYGSVALLGVPISQPLYFFIAGFGFSLVYKEGARKFRVPGKYYKAIVLPIYLLVVLAICVGFDLWGAMNQYWVFSPGWTPLDIAAVWLMLWLACLVSSSERVMAGNTGISHRIHESLHRSARSVQQG
jgi:hypothetical protein